MTVLQAIIFEDAQPGSSANWRSRIEALRSALRHERRARKEIEKGYQAKISELQDENERVKEENRLLRESRSLVAECYQQAAQKLESQFNNRYQAAVESSNRQIQALIDRLDRAKQYIAWLAKQYFGQKSEKMEPQPPVAEGEATNNVVQILEPQPKRKRGQQPGKGNGHGRSDRSQLEVEEEFIEIENCYCPICYKPFRILNETEDSKTAEINVRAYRRVYRRQKAVSQCQCKGRRIVIAPAAPKLYPKTQIGNSLWIYLIVWKYLRGVPINRILQDLSLRGLHLSIGTVIGGFVFISVLKNG